jgi:hypothetical protein
MNKMIALGYYVNRFPTMNKFEAARKQGDGADDQQAGADSADFKRGGSGPGRNAHDQIDVYEERGVTGDESAGDVE